MKNQYGLGRLPSTFDPRDYSLKNFIPLTASLSLVTERLWEFPDKALDQGDTPHCVGFGIANFGINLPVHFEDTNEDGHKFYYMAKEFDGPNSPLEEGSTVRSAAKVLRKLGRVETYAFATNIEMIRWWILNRGPVLAGTLWTTGMFTPLQDNTLSIDGNVAGGHFYIVNEWRSDNYMGIQNSWGEAWGKNGKAYISSENFEKLFMRDGEVIAAVELENFSQSNPCFLKRLFKDIFSK